MKKILSKLRNYNYIKKHQLYYHPISDMKINIVFPEKDGGWIIQKFAQSVNSELLRLGYSSKISSVADSSCHVNHFFIPNMMGMYINASEAASSTFMITHVDSMRKVENIKRTTDLGAIGICMSEETRNRLIAYGIKPNRICYINPAQDGQIKPRKIRLGFTHRLYSDNRKRNDLIVDVCKGINPQYFEFAIMGSGWDAIVDKIRDMGFYVEYYKDFDKKTYNSLIASLDYYCYFGFDEGSMGYLDAVAAGIGTIVTPQGYHLDTEYEITYPVKTLRDIVNVLQALQRKKEVSQRFIAEWTWEAYTQKHLEIWKYQLRAESYANLLAHQSNYKDGIFSLLLDDLQYGKSLMDYVSNAIKRRSL